jgi:hypothetical protein
MFHPYSVQPGTATLDPQVSGMNGQSRMPEINTIPQNFPGIGQIPGYPTPIQYGYPTGYPTTPFGTPVVNGLPTTMGLNCVPSTYPIAGAYPNVNPYVNPFVGYANPFTPYVNNFNPYALSNVIPNGYCNPFTPTYQPIVNTWNPYAITPTYAGLNPLTAAACCPTPAGFINPALGYHPFMTTPFVTTPFGIFPSSLISGAHHSFRTGAPYIAPQPTISNIPTLTGNPTIDSAIVASCCTPNIHTNFAAQTPVTLPNISNPFVGGINPFVATNPINALWPNTCTPTSIPHTGGFNPLFYNTNCMTDPYSQIRTNPSVFGGLNGWNNPWNGSNIWNHFQSPGSIWNTGLGFNAGYHNVVHNAAINPIGAVATATGTPIGPIGPINNPFFNPTNIAHGIPGFSTNVVNPFGAGACGPVSCN